MPDEGYFPRGKSVLRMVQEEKAVGLFYGQRALGIGALAPLNFIGTQRHTRASEQPFKRLVRTGKMFETIFFGSKSEADRVLKIVSGLHKQVVGEIPKDSGSFPAGTPYSAMDPELMLWTMAVMADSAKAFYELFIRDLEPHELDAFWDDYLFFAELFGMPREHAPGSWNEFQEWFDARLHAPEAHLSPEARHTASATMFQIPVPLTRWPAMRVHNLIMLGSLPPKVREHYGLTWSPAQAAALRGLLTFGRVTRPLATDGMRYGYNTREFDMVAKTERKIIASGRPAPGALPADVYA